MRVTWFLLVVVPLSALGQDLANGRDVNGTCAACHGANGQGGKGGEYPRIAGQPAEYIVAQLKAFQARKRFNMPMFPYTEPRELPESDMKDVAAYLSSVVLPTKAPEFKDSDGALARLQALEKVLVVPLVEGDREHGATIYRRKCASCHGRDGRGKKGKKFPMLVGQYPSYLFRQVDAFVKGTRGHELDDGMGVITRVSETDVKDIFAWLTSIQSQEPASGSELDAPAQEDAKAP